MSTLDAINGVVNACQAAPNIVTGGQPKEHHIRRLKVAQGAVVLDLRDPMEARDFDEPAAVRAEGMEYVNVAVNAGAITEAELDRILEVLRANRDREVFVHCASANRVGGALIPYFMLDLGMDEDAAIEQAMRVGLRSPELMEWGLEYARRRAKP